MATCSICRKSGIFLALDKFNACNNCKTKIYPVLERQFEILNDCLTLIQTSKNIKTRLGRIDFAKGILAEFLVYEKNGYKGFMAKTKSTVPFMIEELEKLPEIIFNEAVELEFKLAMSKAEIAKTGKSKVAATNKGIEKIAALAIDLGECPMMRGKILELRTYGCRAMYDEMVYNAEKYEFKGNKKKALDLYQDTLFFVMKDEIEDTQQREIMDFLNRKISELQSEKI